MIAARNGDGFRPVPVSYCELHFLKELKCGTVGNLPGHWIPAEHRQGEVTVNGRRFKTRTAEGLVYRGAIYRQVQWNPTSREYDVVYRLTPGTDISFRGDYILLPGV